MKSEVLSHFNQPWIPSLGLIIFICIFAGVSYFALHKENKDLFNRAGAMPLTDGEKDNE